MRRCRTVSWVVHEVDEGHHRRWDFHPFPELGADEEDLPVPFCASWRSLLSCAICLSFCCWIRLAELSGSFWDFPPPLPPRFWLVEVLVVEAEGGARGCGVYTVQ